MHLQVILCFILPLVTPKPAINLVKVLFFKCIFSRPSKSVLPNSPGGSDVTKPPISSNLPYIHEFSLCLWDTSWIGSLLNPKVLRQLWSKHICGVLCSVTWRSRSPPHWADFSLMKTSLFLPNILFSTWCQLLVAVQFVSFPLKDLGSEFNVILSRTEYISSPISQST